VNATAILSNGTTVEENGAGMMCIHFLGARLCKYENVMSVSNKNSLLSVMLIPQLGEYYV
jgi:hypothetical protein